MRFPDLFDSPSRLAAAGAAACGALAVVVFMLGAVSLRPRGSEIAAALAFGVIVGAALLYAWSPRPLRDD